MNQAQEILQSMAERFATTASVKQVFGEPIERGNKTIIPVARVHIAWAAAMAAENRKGPRSIDHWPPEEVAGAAW